MSKIKKAAAVFCVPKSTIHLKKAVSKEPKTSAKAIYSEEQERELGNYITK